MNKIERKIDVYGLYVLVALTASGIASAFVQVL